MYSSFEMVDPKAADIGAGYSAVDSVGKQDSALAAQIDSLVQAIANWLTQQSMAPTPPSDGSVGSPVDQPATQAPAPPVPPRHGSTPSWCWMAVTAGGQPGSRGWVWGPAAIGRLKPWLTPWPMS